MVVFRSTPVALFIALTVAPGTTAPDGSLTTPVMTPEFAVCARADIGGVNDAMIISATITGETTLLKLKRFMSVLLSKVRSLKQTYRRCAGRSRANHARTTLCRYACVLECGFCKQCSCTLRTVVRKALLCGPKASFFCA